MSPYEWDPPAPDWKALGVPARYLNVPAEDLRPDGSRFLWGPPGSGKTWRAVAILKAAHGCGRSVRFLPLPELQLARRAALRLPTGEPLPGDDAITRGFVVMDDLARDPRVTDFWEEFLAGIILARYNSMKPILFTSNFPLSEVQTRLGQHITDRIVEMCENRIEKMDGSNLRRKPK